MMGAVQAHKPKTSATPLVEDLNPKRLLLAADCAPPTVNGVTDSVQELQRELESRGHQVHFIGPQYTLPNPLYPQVPIPLPRTDMRSIAAFVKDFAPHFIHLAGEATIALQLRALCLDKGYEFTTSFHTLWPHYAQHYLGIPETFLWNRLRAFHNSGQATMTRSPYMVEELTRRGFHHVVEWNGSYDEKVFFRRPRKLTHLKRPILLYVGRVAVEKNIEEFLACKVDFGTKVVVGDGPIRAELERRYPEVVFVGVARGEQLAQWFNEGDVFVFPSKSDTFGRVIVQALACGVPVASLPVRNVRDIITHEGLGALSNDLAEAIEIALQTGVPDICIEHARKYSLARTTDQFLSHLTPSRVAAD